MGKKPVIRFEGYTEDWEQRKLGEVATFINGRAYSQDELLSSGKYRVLRVGNFYTNDSWYYSDMELDDKYYASDGDLLYTWSATFGPHIWRGDKVIYHYHIWKIELLEALEKRFAVQLLEKDKQAIFSDKNGSTMVHITKKGMEEKEVILPTDVNEQRKIGDYLESLDNLITLHQCNYEKMVATKKSMLDKLFPQGEEKVPAIRFEGFKGDWEKKPLGEIFKEYSEKGYENLPPLTIIQGGGTILRNECDRKLMYNKENLSGYKLVRKGDFIVHLRSFEGGLELATTTGIISPAYHTLHGENVDSDFYYAYFRSRKFIDIDLRRHVYGIRDGRSIDINGMKSILIPYTSNKEQKQIAGYLNSLDDLIELYRIRVEKMKNIKAACLQGMFV